MLPYLVCSGVWSQGKLGSLVIWGLVSRRPLSRPGGKRTGPTTPAFGLLPIPLLLHPFIFLCVMRGERNDPQSTVLPACDISGKEMLASPWDPSEAPGPLAQPSCPGGSTSEEQKTVGSPHPPCLGRKPCLWPQTHFPKQTCSGRLQQEGREEESRRQYRQSQREKSWSQGPPTLPGPLLGPAHPYPNPGGLDQWEAGLPSFPELALFSLGVKLSSSSLFFHS